MILCVLAKRDDLPERGGVNDIGVCARDLPLVDGVFEIVGRTAREGVGGQGVRRYHLAVVSVERLITGAGRVVEAGMKSETEQAALVVGVSHVERGRYEALKIQRRRRPQNP